MEDSSAHLEYPRVLREQDMAPGPDHIPHARALQGLLDIHGRRHLLRSQIATPAFSHIYHHSSYLHMSQAPRPSQRVTAVPPKFGITHKRFACLLPRTLQAAFQVHLL